VEILKQNTVKEYLFTDQIPKICSNDGIGMLKSIIPPLSNDGELLPGVSKGWSCGLMMNLHDSPSGRKAGSGSWAGLGNIFYWIDPSAGKLGVVMTSLLPFMDESVLDLTDALERFVYGVEH
jgi:methyl acetate hydrolase